MLNWLTGNWDLFGLSGQNWMLLIGSALILYIVLLLVSDRRHPV